MDRAFGPIITVILLMFLRQHGLKRDKAFVWDSYSKPSLNSLQPGGPSIHRSANGAVLYQRGANKAIRLAYPRLS